MSTIIEIIGATFSNQSFISAISSTVLVILIGYYCRRKGIFTEAVSAILSSVVLTLALPCLAYTSFMRDLVEEQLRQSYSVLIWGLLMYVVLILVTKLMYFRHKGDENTTLRMISIFGSTTFIGIPIISAVLESEGTIYANVFNIGYRVFLYSYCFIVMSGLSFKKENLKQIFLNPIVLATVLGMLVWALQHHMPQVDVLVINEAGLEEVVSYGFMRIDQTAYWLYRPMKYLADLSSPLAWLATGSTLGAMSLGDAFQDKRVWKYTFNKVVMVPVINLIILVVLNYLKILPMDTVAISTVVVMMATPPASVAVSYAIAYKREAELASNASLVATVVSVIAIPIWLILLNILTDLHVI